MAFSIGNLIARIKVDTSDISVAQRAVASSTSAMSSAFSKSGQAAESFGQKIENAGKKTKRTADNIDDAGGAVSILAGGYGKLAAAALAYINVRAAEYFLKQAESAEMLSTRIKRATDSNSEFLASQQALIKISNETGASLDSVVGTFQGFKLVSKDVGVTNAESLKLVETLYKMGRIAGTSTENLNAGIRQFGQSLAKGSINGDELTSVLENIPELAKVIATSLNVSTDKLKEMGEKGQLVMSKILPGILAESEKVSKEFKDLPVFLDMAGTELENSLSFAFKEINKELGITEAIANRILVAAKNIRTLSGTDPEINRLTAQAQRRQAATNVSFLKEQLKTQQELDEQKNKGFKDTYGFYKDESGAIQRITAQIENETAAYRAAEEAQAEAERQLGMRVDAGPGETPKPKKIPKSQTDEYLQKRAAEGQAALNARASQLKAEQELADEAAQEEIRKKEEIARKRAEVGQAALDNRAKQFQQEIDEYNAYYAELDAKAAEYYAKQEELEQQELERRASVGQAALDTRARQFEAEKEAQAQALQTQLTAYSAFSNQMLQLMSDAGNEQSSLYKAMLLFSQALAVAQIIIETNVAAAKTRAALAPFGEGQAQMTLATGYASAGLVAGMAVGKTIGGGRRHGGNVYADTMHKVAEGGPEILTQGKDKYLISDKQGKVTPISEHTATPQMPTVNVTLIEDSSRAGTVQQTQSQAGIDIKVFTSLIRSTVASDIASGGNQISRSLNAVGLKRQGITNG